LRPRRWPKDWWQPRTDAAVSTVVGPAAYCLGEAALSAQHFAKVEVPYAESEQDGGQFYPQGFVRLRGPEVEPALSRQQPQASHGSLLVPIRGDDSLRQQLVGAGDAAQRGKCLNRRPERRQRLEEAGAAPSGVQDAELALRVVETSAACQLNRRPGEWVGQVADAIERAARSCSVPDWTHAVARKLRAAWRTSCGCSARTSAGARSSRPGFMPMNQARTVSADSFWSNS
jgi:hypothetical protein